MSPQLNQAIVQQIRDQAARANRRLEKFDRDRDFGSMQAAAGAMGKLGGMIQIYFMQIDERTKELLTLEMRSTYASIWDILLAGKGINNVPV